jgi:opacity protein-like surface antigen
MKKIIFILVVLSIPFYGTAQNKISFGAKAGVSLASSKSYDTKAGLCAGGFASIKLTNLISFQPEALFTSKGFSIKDVIIRDAQGNKIKSITVKHTYNYIEIPLLLKIGIGDKTRPYLITGISPAFLISSKLKDDTGSRKVSNIETFDLGAVIGAGVEFNISNNTYLFIEPRYNYGITEFISGYNNRSIYVLAGIRF